MSSRRLVSRTQHTAESQQTPLRSTAQRPGASLPPYQPPSCPLTEKGKRDLESITQNQDYRKYSEHLKRAIDEVTGTAADALERFEAQKRSVEKRAQRRAQDGSQHDKTEAEEQLEEHLADMESKVETLAADAEKAMRDLIDYQEELAQQTISIREITENVASMPAPTPRARRRNVDADSDADDADYEEPVASVEPEMPASILSPTELIRSAQQQHTSLWKAKSMRARYAENNDYKGFKGVIHNSRHPGENAPPVPHSRTWFPEDASRPGRRSQIHPDDDDDDVVVEGLTMSMKCPLTLRMFKEPYSNSKCPHVFEKDAILEFHRQNAVSFQEGSRRRGQNVAPKQLKCPQTGCVAMLELDDFYVDALMARQVKRAREVEEMGESDDDVDDDSRLPTGSQRKPEEIDDEEVRRRRTLDVKRERESVRNLSQTVDGDSDVEMADDD